MTAHDLAPGEGDLASGRPFFGFNSNIQLIAGLIMVLIYLPGYGSA